jgi:hypothetical protein
VEQEVVFHTGEDAAGGFDAGQDGPGGHHAFNGRLVGLIYGGHNSSSRIFITEAL